MDVITQWLVDVFRWINDTITGNFGLTIILFTVAFRLVCLPLDIYSRKGQRDYQLKMAMLQPELDKLNAAYKNEPEKLNRKTMELRKKMGVGMMPKGCLSQLLVYPLFFAFFAVFRNMAVWQTDTLANLVELYGAESTQVAGWLSENSFLWIKNIWMPDNLFNTSEVPVIRAIPFISFNADILPQGTYLDSMMKTAAMPTTATTWIGERLARINITGHNGFLILPLLAGGAQYISMKLTQRMNPQNDAANPAAAQTGTMNKWMGIIFPIMFVYFCLTSSSALAIYWIVSSVVMLGTNYLIQKMLEKRESMKKDREGI